MPQVGASQVRFRAVRRASRPVDGVGIVRAGAMVDNRFDDERYVSRRRRCC